ncbi:PKD domain-containing protein [Nocardioides sp. AX2bis]|uniref:PKD domain-containing protein n=1 Tax=Nocardioides sp. AX2bis TaxID=2653157 RepID=UPI001356D87F|nr:PKD domain-containing protein [Nocardioides sp. AX2bis]
MTSGLVAEALRRVPLPAAVIEVQPPNGRTLVNFDTNFFTAAGDLDRTITLLGQQVDLQISAASYTWVFGDGQSLQTTSPGAAYPQLDVTHRYLGAGEVEVRVDVTYTAQFSVEGGPFAPVPGSVTVAGGPEPLQVVEARPTLVG